MTKATFSDPSSKAMEFLAIADHFKLGFLPTESQHPDTLDLGQWARDDLARGVAALKTIDVGVLRKIADQNDDIARLREAVTTTLNAGGDIYFYGCGATGRLSLSLEYLWRFSQDHDALSERVHGFMSGGDLALVHSIESFEDHPEWGARQVDEIGFGGNDLIIGITEGGETPSVIGATKRAAEISRRRPFFLYCNPDEALQNIERSRDILADPGIENLYLDTGPMALSGSTRMQATTAQMLLAGAALMDISADRIADFADFVEKSDFSFLDAFIEKEADIYQNGDYVLYEADEYAITVMTDTTERAPTFSLRGFENQRDPERKPSLSYIFLPHAHNSADAWRRILKRAPEGLEWDDLKGTASQSRLLGFDFSQAAKGQRENLIAPAGHSIFRIARQDGRLHFDLDDLHHDIDISPIDHPLLEHIFLKMILNTHSTLVMGRMGRYESNVMTWVKPSNYKLIDRAIRYVDHLLQRKGIDDAGYDYICQKLFEETDRLQQDESIVLKTVQSVENHFQR